MKNKHFISAITVAILILALATPIYAIEHSAVYEWSGTVNMEKQAGHHCNTGAEQKQTIAGEGWMYKEMKVEIKKDVLSVNDNQNFKTAAEAVDNLTVNSTIELCAPGKHEVTPKNYYYDQNEVWAQVEGDPETLGVFAGYDMGWEDDPGYIEGFIAGILKDYRAGIFTAKEAAQMISALKAAEDMDEARKVAEGFIGKGTGDEVVLAIPDEFERRMVEALTEQIWAVQVEAGPGKTGALAQSFEAAYGDWAGITDDFAEEFSDYVDAGRAEYDEWAHTYADDRFAIEIGREYAGNYFYIDQLASTDDGELKRYIDVSSPWSGTFVSEDMTVSGEAGVEEAFRMVNLGPGEEIVVDWHELF